VQALRRLNGPSRRAPQNCLHAYMLACCSNRSDNVATMNSAQATGKPPSSDGSVGQEKIPLQVRLGREDIRAIKIAAAESEQTISDFLLGCFRCWQATTSGSGTKRSKARR
jgi:hypothetical protein